MRFHTHGLAAKAVVVGVALLSAFSNRVQAQDAKTVKQLRKTFSSIVAFGDSLTDNGNLFAVTGLPPKPYFKGRISNGIVWVEYLAKTLRLKRSLKNYAFAGATTGRFNVNSRPGIIEFPGLLDQIDAFESSLGGQPADPEALYVVWAGSNDVLEFGPLMQTANDGITNTIDAIQRLHTAGARHILVVNIPDLGLAPVGQSADPDVLSLFVDSYNEALTASLDLIEDAGIETIRLDAAQILRDVVACPECYRLKNVTDAVLDTGTRARRSLFWDSEHPTTRGHKIFAEAAVRVLAERFVPATPNTVRTRPSSAIVERIGSFNRSLSP